MSPHPFKQRKLIARCYERLCALLCLALADILKLTSRGNRPLQMEFEDQLHAITFSPLQEQTPERTCFTLFKRMPLPVKILSRKEAFPRFRLSKP